VTDLPSVQAAVSAVIADVDAVGKEGQFDGRGGGYKYRRVADVYNALQAPLAKHGVVITGSVVEYERADLPEYGKGGWHRLTSVVEWTVTGPAGDSLPPMRVPADGLDNGDKAFHKAWSYSFKMAMGTLFCLRDDDPDLDNEHRDAPPPPLEETKQARDDRELLAAQIGVAPDDVKAAMGEWLKSQRWTLRHPLETGQLDQISNMFDEIAQTGAGASADPTRPGSADGAADEGETTNEGEHE
jgi:hypothetical protein